MGAGTGWGTGWPGASDAVAGVALGSLQRLADDLRARGDDVDRLADDVVEAVRRTGWAGRAAEAAHARSRERGTTLRRAADDHRRAAAAVEAHARSVAAVAALGGAVAAAVLGEVAGTLSDVLDGAP